MYTHTHVPNVMHSVFSLAAAFLLDSLIFFSLFTLLFHPPSFLPSFKQSLSPSLPLLLEYKRTHVIATLLIVLGM